MCIFAEFTPNRQPSIDKKRCRSIDERSKYCGAVSKGNAWDSPHHILDRMSGIKSNLHFHSNFLLMSTLGTEDNGSST